MPRDIMARANSSGTSLPSRSQKVLSRAEVELTQPPEQTRRTQRDGTRITEIVALQFEFMKPSEVWRVDQGLNRIRGEAVF